MVQTHGVAVLHQKKKQKKTGHNVTREPKYPQARTHTKKKLAAGKEEEEEQAVRDGKERRERTMAAALFLFFFHTLCSYIILP